MDSPRGQLAARASQATAQWADPAVLEQVGYTPGDTWFGYTLTEHSSPFGYSDDRHIVTLAGSRTGKGTSTIIPNLCEYPGSLICIDPKGENASITAARRGKGSVYAEGMGQKVWVLDPFKAAHVEDDLRGCFNPLDCIDPAHEEAVDDAGAVAESLIVATNSKDAHWDESARVFLQGLILYVAVTEPPERRHLPRVRELLTLGDREAAEEANQDGGESVNPFFLLLARMKQREEFYGVIAAAAATLMDTGDDERGSILSTARRNTSFIDSPGMRQVLLTSSFSLDDLKQSPHGLSLYLCLPARRLETHGRWLRTVIMLAIGHMERLGNRPATGYPVLLLLDEFATLGHLSSLEKAVGFIAGYGVKLWIILQDLNQLKANYKDSWETFLGNAGILQFFGNSDMTTLEYISNRLGQTELRQQTTGSSQSENESSSVSRSESRSVSHGQNRSSSSGHNSSSSSSGTNASYSETFGTTDGSTFGTGSSISRNESIAVAPLMRPDEIAKAFGRGTERQILFIAGAPPVVMGQTNYFRDPYFIGKFDPHPDHPESVPPTLEELKAQRLEYEKEQRQIEDASQKAREHGLKLIQRGRRLKRIGYILLAVIGLGMLSRFILQATPFPVEQLSLRVGKLTLQKVAGGHMLNIHSLLTNKSEMTLGTAKIGWNGRYCVTRLANGQWGNCTPFHAPETTLNTTLAPKDSAYLSTDVGPVSGLRGTVLMEGRIIEASE